MFRLNRNKKKSNRNSLIEHNLVFFKENVGLFRFVSKQFVSVFHFYTETASFAVSIEPKQTEDQPKQFDREHIVVFFLKHKVVSVCFGLFWFVLVCFGLFRNNSVCFCCFDIGSKHRNKPNKLKFIVFGLPNKPNTTETTKQTETDFVSF